MEEALGGGSQRDVEDELGDLLFSVVNLIRHRGSDPEVLMAAANAKFEQRFARMEEQLRNGGISLEQASLEAMETAWQAAKRP